MSGSHDDPPDSSSRLYLAVGAVAAAAALLSTPVLGALGALHFVPGLGLAVVAPTVCGGVALVAAGLLYRRDDAGNARRVAVAAVLAMLVGVAFGLQSVF